MKKKQKSFPICLFVFVLFVSMDVFPKEGKRVSCHYGFCLTSRASVDENVPFQPKYFKSYVNTCKSFAGSILTQHYNWCMESSRFGIWFDKSPYDNFTVLRTSLYQKKILELILGFVQLPQLHQQPPGRTPFFSPFSYFTVQDAWIKEPGHRLLVKSLPILRKCKFWSDFHYKGVWFIVSQNNYLKNCPCFLFHKVILWQSESATWVILGEFFCFTL